MFSDASGVPLARPCLTLYYSSRHGQGVLLASTTIFGLNPFSHSYAVESKDEPIAAAWQSYAAWKAVVIFLHAIAVLSTLYRLAHRFRIHRLWWDDYIVFVPLLFDLIYWIVACARFPAMIMLAPLSTRLIIRIGWLLFQVL
ncbi:hypothetical protein CPB84DRAFT_971574 [Gymnopilus junonius]|uniref:Transmembrane protein n=1 Tax=Gymnopilus junonius TaxID=109634 RepID=A0A9P5TNF6_GYMJU|nr:hypothetical protein CPB84DRAFT_971574 [Gymnopilus junonius]